MALLIFRPALPTLPRTVPPPWFSSPRALRLSLPLTRPTTSWARPFALWPTPFTSCFADFLRIPISTLLRFQGARTVPNFYPSHRLVQTPGLIVQAIAREGDEQPLGPHVPSNQPSDSALDIPAESVGWLEQSLFGALRAPTLSTREKR